MSSGSSSSESVVPAAGREVPTPPVARVCRRCGSPRVGSGPHGLCPRCLLGCALEETWVDGNVLGAPSGLPPRFGRYTLLKQIGRGAMGDVYLAHDAQLNRQVALKTPLLERTNDPTVATRFRNEAQLAAAIHHPHICPVYDVGEVDGVLYFTMAYIDGRPLTRWIDDVRPLTVRQIVPLVRKIALAMAHAHQLGIVHRDLKPANILIDKRSEPIIMDFGLARHAAIETRLTQSNAVVGTPAYLAPELISGARDAPVTDVYSLGVILFELLTKRLPFTGHVGEMLAQITRDPAPPPSRFRDDVPRRLDAICLRALAKNPADRYQSMTEFAEALSEFLKAPTDPAAPPTKLEQFKSVISRKSWTEHRSVVIGVGAALALTAFVAVGVVMWPGGTSEEPVGGSGQSPPRDIVSGRGVRGSRSPSALTAAGSSQPSQAGHDATDAAASATTPKPEPDTRSAGPGVPEVSGRSGDATATPAGVANPAEPAASRADVQRRPSVVSPAIDALPAPNQPIAVRGSTKPNDEPRATQSFTARYLDEVRRISVERQRLRQEVAEATERLNGDLPKELTKVNGEFATIRRLGEEATLDRNDVETRLATLNSRRSTGEPRQRQLIDQEIKLAMQNRARILTRLQGLDAEARGKVAEIAKLEKESADLRRTVERSINEAQRLVDLAFWKLDPAGSFESTAYEELARIYSKWLEETPDQVEILALRSVAWSNAGRSDAALSDAQRALGLQPKSPFALAALGYAKCNKGQAPDGISDLGRACRFAPQAPYAYFFRGLAYRNRKNDNGALDDFSKAASLAPPSPWIQSQLALQIVAGHYDKNPNLTQALELSGQACEATSRESWFCLESLAASQAALNRFEEAVLAQQAAVDCAPPEQRFASQRRLALYRSGKRYTFDLDRAEK